MKTINELQSEESRIDIEGEITQKSEPRLINLRTGGPTRFCDCVLNDVTGSVILTLYGSLVDEVNVGDRVSIENGYTRSFRGAIQLNIGHFGKLTVLAKASPKLKEIIEGTLSIQYGYENTNAWLEDNDKMIADFFDNGHIDESENPIPILLPKFNGKRIRITIEEL